VGDALRAKRPLPSLITVEEHAVVKEALDLLRKYEISQLPVLRGTEVIGSINDVAVMQAVFDHADIVHKEVREVMGHPFPTLDTHCEIERAYKLLALANAAIVVTQEKEPIGVLTRQDLISFLSASAA
jgi:cystathionine beta-synthase